MASSQPSRSRPAASRQREEWPRSSPSTVGSHSISGRRPLGSERQCPIPSSSCPSSLPSRPRPVTVARTRNSRSAPHWRRLWPSRFWIIVHTPRIISPSRTTIHNPTTIPTTHVMGEASPRPNRQELGRGWTARLYPGIRQHRTQAGPYSAVRGPYGMGGAVSCPACWCIIGVWLVPTSTSTMLHAHR